MSISPLTPPPPTYHDDPRSTMELITHYNHLTSFWVSPNTSTNRRRHRPRPQQLLQVRGIASEIAQTREDNILILEAETVTVDHGNQQNRLKISEKNIATHLKIKDFKKCKNSNEDDEKCAICLCDFEEKEKIGVLHCRHEYHENCIKNWLLTNNVCPLCRAKGLVFEDEEN